MADNAEALKTEIKQLEANYSFLLNYFRVKIQEKRAERDKLRGRS